ncbi:hypothetical protein HDV04_006028 [Boothiomyces sp. JEL0838]|nr:hypothetical protein HDV04_006028 [Boothiomyces sp. JEL0838]
MQSITIVGYLMLVVRNVVNNQGKFKMSALDNICVLATISNAFRIAILANARYAYYADRNTISAADLARNAEAGVGVVSAGAGVNIYSDFKIGDKVISPDKILKLIRLIMLSLGITMCIGWSNLGVWNGEYYYRAFRRGTSICDQRMNYIGCDAREAFLFSVIDSIMLAICCFSFSCAAYLFIKSICSKRVGKYVAGANDKLCIICMISIAGRIAQLANLHTAYIYKDQLSDSQIIRHFQANVMFEFVFYSAGALGSNIFLVGIVSAIAGVELYPELMIGDRKISPPKILSIIRLTISLLALSISISWATAGATEGIYWYVVFRRINYLLSVCVIIFITIPVITFFGTKVIRFLSGTMKVLEKKRTIYTEDQSTLGNNAESQSLGIAKKKDRLANFKSALYAVILHMYIFTLFNHTCLLVGFELEYFQNNTTALMGAKDKISIVAIIAVLGRIAQLSNARTASYSSMNLTDTDIIRYFQANVMLEFTFYTAGALGSNIFLVGVVSASAGVKLYPDMYINGRLLSPEKILSLVRIFILTLALTVSVCWATVGAMNGIYWYVVFRRFNYLLSICVVAFISFPVLTYFGSRMNRMIEKTVKVLEKPKPSYTIEASTNDHAVSNSSK